MLMFDNAIFASFIPQVLMVLGYVSCILLPGLSKSLPQQTADSTSHQAEYIAKADTHQATYVVSFSEVARAVVADPSPQVPPPAEQSVRTGFRVNVFHAGDKISFSLFSRPPPSFC